MNSLYVLWAVYCKALKIGFSYSMARAFAVAYAKEELHFTDQAARDAATETIEYFSNVWTEEWA